jgi:hypothetical protein
MPGREQIPPLSVIHLGSRSSSALELGRFPLPELTGSPNTGLAYVQIADLPSTARISDLAKEWTRQVPRGWPQVEAVVSRLKGGNYLVDREAELPTDCDDAAAHFLFTARRGPDFLFATSAAQMLRSLGYPTRVASGLYVNPARYDRTSQQTKVIAEDAHFWVEVAVSGTTWMTVDPTPGYEVRAPRRNVAQSLVAAAREVWRWTTRHWTYLVVGLALAACLGSIRLHLLNGWYTLLWAASQASSPTARLLATVYLLERRARLAGCGRPAHVTLRGWYLPLASVIAPRDKPSIEAVLSSVAATLYGSQPLASPAADRCPQIARIWTLNRFQAAARANRQSSLSRNPLP